jgi:hypothetical protein
MDTSLRHRQMIRTAAALFGAASVITLISIFAPHQPQLETEGLAFVAAGTVFVSFGLLFNGERLGGASGGDEMYYLRVMRPIPDRPAQPARGRERIAHELARAPAAGRRSPRGDRRRPLQAGQRPRRPRPQATRRSSASLGCSAASCATGPASRSRSAPRSTGSTATAGELARAADDALYDAKRRRVEPQASGAR